MALDLRSQIDRALAVFCRMHNIANRHTGGKLSFSDEVLDAIETVIKEFGQTTQRKAEYNEEELRRYNALVNLITDLLLAHNKEHNRSNIAQALDEMARAVKALGLTFPSADE